MGENKGRIKGVKMPIDPILFKKQIEKKGITFEEVADMLGYDVGSLKRAISVKAITRPMATSMKLILGIDYDLYKPQEQHEESTEESIEVRILRSIETHLALILQKLETIENQL